MLLVCRSPICQRWFLAAHRRCWCSETCRRILHLMPRISIAAKQFHRVRIGRALGARSA